MYRNIILIVAGLIILVILLNPTNSDFNNYVRAKDFRTVNKGLQFAHGGRISYYFVFSVFQGNTTNYQASRDRTYVGFCKNFFLMDEKSGPPDMKQKF